MYFEDHGQPHIHAAKAEREGKYFWRTGKWIGSLPPAETRKVEVWAKTRHKELERAWQCLQDGRSVPKMS